MDQYIIKGGNPLVGEVEIGGAKNAALAILAAAIMTDDTVRLENLPDVNDINVLLEAIGGIGAKVEQVDRHTAVINVFPEYIKNISEKSCILLSVGCASPRKYKKEVPLPGGCNIGSRPIDLHLKASVHWNNRRYQIRCHRICTGRTSWNSYFHGYGIGRCSH